MSKFKSELVKMAAVTGTALLVTVGGTLIFNEVKDPRQDDAFDHTVFNQCVGEDWVFVYGLKGGSYESTILENASKCGGDPRSGMWDEDRIEPLDKDGQPVKR